MGWIQRIREVPPSDISRCLTAGTAQDTADVFVRPAVVNLIRRTWQMAAPRHARAADDNTQNVNGADRIRPTPTV